MRPFAWMLFLVSSCVMFLGCGGSPKQETVAPAREMRTEGEAVEVDSPGIDYSEAAEAPAEPEAASEASEALPAEKAEDSEAGFKTGGSQ